MCKLYSEAVSVSRIFPVLLTMPAKSGAKAGGKRIGGKAAKSKTPKAKGAKKGRGKKAVRSWSLYIFKVLKQVHSDTGISNKAMSIMNSFISDIFDRLCSEASMCFLDCSFLCLS